MSSPYENQNGPFHPAYVQQLRELLMRQDQVIKEQDAEILRLTSELNDRKLFIKHHDMLNFTPARLKRIKRLNGIQD